MSLFFVLSHFLDHVGKTQFLSRDAWRFRIHHVGIFAAEPRCQTLSEAPPAVSFCHAYDKLSLTFLN